MELKDSISHILANYQGHAAILIKENSGQTLYALNTTELFRSASLIKLAIAAYLSKNLSTEDLQRTLTIREEQVVVGSGVIYHLKQRKWQLMDLLDLMLSVSDNTATNVLLDYLGIEKVDLWLQQNYPEITLHRPMMSSPLKGENTLTLQSIMQLWQNLLQQSTAASTVILSALRFQDNRGKLRAWEDSSAFLGKAYSKTGELAHEEHDIVHFCLGERAIDCGVLTHFAASTERMSAIKLQQEIGRVVMEWLTES